MPSFLKKWGMDTAALQELRMNIGPTAQSSNTATGWSNVKPPLQRFLTDCHAEFFAETGGAVADYIPELSKADPAHFGIGLATLDGHRHRR
jgi:Glutaminase